MLLHVTDAKYIEDYKVAVSFDNGRKGVADLSDVLWGEVFEPLKDISLFSKVKFNKDIGTIVWSNGADIAPESLYFRAFKDDPELQSQFREWGYIE